MKKSLTRKCVGEGTKQEVKQARMSYSRAWDEWVWNPLGPLSS